jgi:hypothetical protein
MIGLMGRRPAQVAQGLYVGLAASLAVLHWVTDDPRWVFAAVIVTLPLGLVAFVAVYAGYALIQGVGGLFVATRTPDGSETAWLSATTHVLIVVLFVGAAVGNILLLRYRQRHAAKAPAYPASA